MFSYLFNIHFLSLPHFELFEKKYLFKLSCLLNNYGSLILSAKFLRQIIHPKCNSTPHRTINKSQQKLLVFNSTIDNTQKESSVRFAFAFHGVIFNSKDNQICLNKTDSEFSLRPRMLMSPLFN